MLKPGKSSTKLLLIIAAGTLLVLCASEPAHAYTDPGTGGLLYQIIIVLLALLGSYFAFFKNWIARKFKGKAEAREDDEKN